jgi:hypothetical protein
MDTLTDRQLNRATLARQMLLERSRMGIADAVAFLGGLQAQQSNDPYIALWSRLDGFTQDQLTALIVDRTLARATTMRGTLHLHTADDLIGVRGLVQDFLKGMWNSNFRKRFGGEDEKQVRRAGVKLLDAKAPMTAGALGKALREKFPTAEAQSLAVLMQVTETLVQVPPTRLWGNGGAPLLTRVENWLPPPHERPMTRIDLVRRYLRAFGPASINDAQTWCRLTKLSVEFELLQDELVTFRSEAGRTLYDYPDAPRPDAEVPAPVRFLPLYDNVYLGYEDRRRMLADGDTQRVNLLLAGFKPAVLVDGVVSATWSVQTRKGAARLVVEPYRKLRKAELRDLEREAVTFLRFMAPAAESRDVEVLALAG